MAKKRKYTKQVPVVATKVAVVKPRFPVGTVIAVRSFVTDSAGVLWWVDPEVGTLLARP